MLNEAFIRPRSIAVIGASNTISKPGGKLTFNLLAGNFEGELYLVNPKQETVQGKSAYSSIKEIGARVDLAFIALPAHMCLGEIEKLFHSSKTRSFVIISAGFSELGSEGVELERSLHAFAKDNDCQIWGPNCTGLITEGHTGIFTTPVPNYDPGGVTLVSSSGATAVFLMEEGLHRGLSFGGIFSVGNGMMLYLEDILEFLDASYSREKSSPVLLLYIESIKDPVKFHRHASSLTQKGCRLAAVKAGRTASGSRAASSHTGALANPDDAVSSLMRKAGIIRCANRNELITVGQVLQHKPLKGNRIAVVTHAGGPGVMTADTLDEGGFILPQPDEQEATVLLQQLYPGSSVANPFDILATATKRELSVVLDYVNNSGKYDSVIVIFGSPGLFEEETIFRKIAEYQDRMFIPLYTVTPSVINTRDEITMYKGLGKHSFIDESLLAQALGKVYQQSTIARGDYESKNEAIDAATEGDYLPASVTHKWLAEVGFTMVDQLLANTIDDALTFAGLFELPVVLKASDIQHKTEQKALFLDIRDEVSLKEAFDHLRTIAKGPLLIQRQLEGHEVYLGINKDPLFGHQLFVGHGGIYLESFQDIQSSLLPIGREEAKWLMQQLKVYPIWDGVRGQQGINLDGLVKYMMSLNKFITEHQEIVEMDINPLIAVGDELVVVDARIKVA